MLYGHGGRGQGEHVEALKAGAAVGSSVALSGSDVATRGELGRHFGELLRQVELASFVLDADGHVTYCNDYLLRLTGRQADEVLGKSTGNLLMSMSGEAHAGIVPPADMPARWNQESQIVTASGERRLICWHNVALYSSDGAVNGTASIGEDITSHRVAEDKLSKLNRIYAMLSGINALILRAKGRQELFNGACGIAVEHGEFGMAWIGLLDPVTLDITPTAWAGVGSEAYSTSKSTARADVSSGQGAVGRAIRERRAIFSNDILKEPGVGGRRRADAAERGYRSLITLPLLMNGAVIGNFSLFARGLDFFNEEEVKLLSDLTADISFALEHIATEEKVQYLARYDLLTGLPNRTQFYDALQKILGQAKDHGWIVSVLIIDLDRFKAVNETLGHNMGDQLLRQYGERLVECLRSRDIVARIGGDEFGIILITPDQPLRAEVVGNKILTAMHRPFTLGDREVTVTGSIGITVYPIDSEDAGVLIKNSETAMYRAKEAGRDTYRFYTAEMNASALEKLERENALRKALANDEFVLHYQPKMDLASDRVSSVEALIRWNRPGHGLVPPLDFIPMLEETGLIVQVGAWVIDTACRQISEWGRAGLGPISVAVNLSARQFSHDAVDLDASGDAPRAGMDHQLLEFELQVARAIESHNIDPRLVEFELTESLLMSHAEKSIAILRRLKAHGIGLSIDDFGTGYSSLAYLRRFPIDALKIDRAFIRDITTNADDAAITAAIISLAHSLKLKVVAEGVETAEQLAFLREQHCDEIQGYYLSRPLPAAAISELLSSRLVPTAPLQ
jgi:diguanylate cyclase (GGDEF)-like protein/PAS domain S-box-containing protein